MRNRVLLVVALALLTAAALPGTGRGTIDTVDMTDVPFEWCGPGCETLDRGSMTARFMLDVDPIAETGVVRFTDHGVRYEGRKIAITATIDFIYVFDWMPDGFRYNVHGTYEPTGGSMVPAGTFAGSFEWSYGEPESGFARVHFWNDAAGFSYMNRGAILKGVIAPPPNS